MSFEASSIAELGSLDVVISNNRGHGPEELTALALRRIIYIGDNAPPAIRDQALAYRDRIEEVLRGYFKQAQQSERNSIAIQLSAAGMTEAARLVRSV